MFRLVRVAALAILCVGLRIQFAGAGYITVSTSGPEVGGVLNRSATTTDLSSGVALSVHSLLADNYTEVKLLASGKIDTFTSDQLKEILPDVVDNATFLIPTAKVSVWQDGPSGWVTSLNAHVTAEMNVYLTPKNPMTSPTRLGLGVGIHDSGVLSTPGITRWYGGYQIARYYSTVTVADTPMTYQAVLGAYEDGRHVLPVNNTNVLGLQIESDGDAYRLPVRFDVDAYMWWHNWFSYPGEMYTDFGHTFLIPGISVYDEGGADITNQFTFTDELGRVLFEPTVAQAVPEPSSLILFACGGISALGYRMRRRTV